MGMILIGMPGIEKRIARFPQLYSRIGFVHEFRPLGAAEVQELLERCWTSPGVTLPDSGFTPEFVARLVRMASGNLRLLTRLLTQVERVLGVNDTQAMWVEIVEAARDSLVIGQAETGQPTTNNSTKTTTDNSLRYSSAEESSSKRISGSRVRSPFCSP